MGRRKNYTDFWDKLNDIELRQTIADYANMAHESLSFLFSHIHDNENGFFGQTRQTEIDRRLEIAVFRDFLDSFLNLAKVCPEIKIKWTQREVPWKMLTGLRDKITHDRYNIDYVSTHRRLANNLWNLVNRTRSIAEYCQKAGLDEISLMEMASYPVLSGPEDVFRINVAYDPRFKFSYRVLEVMPEDDARPER